LTTTQESKETASHITLGLLLFSILSRVLVINYLTLVAIQIFIMADASISKPSITGDVEIEREQAPSPPPYTSTSSFPQTIGGPAPSPTAAEGTGDVKFKLAGVAIDISEKQVPMVGLLMASMVNIMAACLGVEESHRYYEYAISTGAVGMVLSAAGIAISWKPALDKGSLGKWVSAICFIWSFIAGCILTFGEGPFVDTGNGFFSCWAMVIFSLQTLVSAS
jgi:hypothetical protein